jgi:uncharacterized membrane protein YesL
MAHPPPESAPANDHRPSFLRVLRRSATALYDHLGLVLAANLTWAAVGALALTAGVLAMRAVGPWGSLAALPVVVFGWAAANAALWYVAHRIATRQDLALGDLAVGMRTHFRVSLGLVGIQASGIVLLAANVGFYLGPMARHVWAPPLAALWLCALVYFLMVMLYAYPFAITQGVGAWAALRKSALVTADNPGFTLLMGAVVAAWTLLVLGLLAVRSTLATGFAALILATCFAAAIAVLASVALAALLPKYQD